MLRHKVAKARLGTIGVVTTIAVMLGVASIASAYQTGYNDLQLIAVTDPAPASCSDASATIAQGYVPRYPQIALEMGKEGDSIVTFTMGLDGSVSNVKLAGTSGNRLFDRAAVDAVSKTRFNPAIQHCSKLAGLYGIHVVFRQSTPDEGQFLVPLGGGARVIKQ